MRRRQTTKTLPKPKRLYRRTVKMLLTALDRAAIMRSMPEKTDFQSLLLIGDINRAVSFTDDEFKAAREKQTGEVEANQVRLTDIPPRECEFNESQKNLIASRLRELDKAKQLDGAHVGIYRMFVNGENGEAK